MTMRTVNVELGERSYPIVIGSDLLGGNFDLNDHLAGGDCLIVSNETVAPLYLDKLKQRYQDCRITRWRGIQDG